MPDHLVLKNYKLNDHSDNEIVKIIGYSKAAQSSGPYEIDVKVRICLTRQIMYVHKTHNLPAKICLFELSRDNIMAIFDLINNLPEKNQLTPVD